MSKNISQTLISDGQLILTPLQVVDLDVDLDEAANMQMLVTVTMVDGTSSVTGVDLKLFGGFGGSDPTATNDPIPHKFSSSVPDFADNYESVSMVTMPTSQGVDTTRKTNFCLDVAEYPRWVRMRFTNLDSAHSARISIKIDM